MSKIDKTDIENIKLITKEAKLSNLSRIKIKKGDYEIELSSESSRVVAPVAKKIPAADIKISEEKIASEQINDENIVKENYFALRLGLSLNDVWFIKRKYN